MLAAWLTVCRPPVLVKDVGIAVEVVKKLDLMTTLKESIQARELAV